jgi:hypothetical protein
LNTVVTLPDALVRVAQAQGMIRELERQLPASSETNFRQRLVNELEGSHPLNPDFRQQAEALLEFYEEVFGVDDVIEKPDG